MGLWTLGQQSRDTKNPIAGILQKELGITVPQGRKIFEQRQKIQVVCNNLKEVSGARNLLISVHTVNFCCFSIRYRLLFLNLSSAFSFTIYLKSLFTRYNL